ncbi:MAG: DUF1877 family protein [Janthinobacterium lividum]
MAIDLTLCVVPAQVYAIFSKAVANPAYAEWVEFVPSILENPSFHDHDLPEVQELKQDVEKLRSFFQFTATDYFYDLNRCSSTLDYLLDAYAQKYQLGVAPQPLWQGGDRIAKELTGGQGIPLQLYSRESLTSIYEFLDFVDPAELLTFYDYEAMQEAGVYKLTSPENTEVITDAFNCLWLLFNSAYEDENLLILKVKD